MSGGRVSWAGPRLVVELAIDQGPRAHLEMAAVDKHFAGFCGHDRVSGHGSTSIRLGFPDPDRPIIIGEECPQCTCKIAAAVPDATRSWTKRLSVSGMPTPTDREEPVALVAR